MQYQMNLYYLTFTPKPKGRNEFILNTQPEKEPDIQIDILERLADGSRRCMHIRKTTTSVSVLSLQAYTPPQSLGKGRQVQVIEGPIDVMLPHGKISYEKGECFLIPPHMRYQIDGPGPFAVVIGLLPESFKDFPDSDRAGVSFS